MIKELEFTDEKLKGQDTFDYQKAFAECFVDLDADLKKPPIAMGIGYHDYKGNMYLNPTFTYGEMSAIIAPKKSKKTFFKSALVASYIGGRTNTYFPSIVSHRRDEKYILDIDTEQGDYYSQMAFKRVFEMVGEKYPKYLPFGTKKKSDDFRLKLIDALMNDPKYENQIGLLVIDGIADLCTNTNNLEKSKYVIEKLMEWTSKGVHILTVIHKTYDKDKARGHLGTYVQEKAETTIFLESTDKKTKNAPIEVRNEDSRGAPFDTFYFDLDTQTTLPKECGKIEW